MAILLILFLGDVLLQRLRGEKALGGKLIEELAAGKKLNVAPFFHSTTQEALERSMRSVELAGGKGLLADFIVKELAYRAEVVAGLMHLGIEPRGFTRELSNIIQSSVTEAEKKKALIVQAGELAKAAFSEAVMFGEATVSPSALFLGALREEASQLGEIFEKLNFSVDDFRNAVIFGRLSRGSGKRMWLKRGIVGRRRIAHRVMNRAWTARPTPWLDQFCEDITDLARADYVGFMVGHQDEYRALVNILSRADKNNALLVGIEGVGKETIIGHLAFKITRDEVPAKLFDRRLVKLPVTSLIAGIKTLGELEARLETIITEVILAGNIVLYLPDIHLLKLTSPAGTVTAFDALKPVFQASVIPVVATTDPQSYRRVIEQDTDFKALFDRVDVESLSPKDALTLLTYESYLLEVKEKIVVSYPAVKRAVELAHRYLRQKPLPASAVGLLQESIAEAKNRGSKALGEDTVAEVASRKAHIPLLRPKVAETELLIHLEDKIHERLINQEEAVRQVASAMRQYRAGISRKGGPIAAFLFAGPTGVGKTELAKILATIYFGGESELIRFDMSEYKDPKSMWNFIGSPDGAVAGNLVESVKANPFAVLLLDEFEKAHKDILDLFLTIFDEGYVVSSAGEQVDMKNLIIIATSNAHSELIKEGTEKGMPFSEISNLLKNRLTEYFKPELLNRFDGVIAFRQLSLEEISKIASLHLVDLVSELEEEQGVSLKIGPGVTEYIAKLGWDPVFGARTLREVVSAKIREMLAMKILSGALQRGSRGSIVLENEQIELLIDND